MTKGSLGELERIAFETGLYADRSHMRREYRVSQYGQSSVTRNVTLGNIVSQLEARKLIETYDQLTHRQQLMCVYLP